MAHVHSYSQRDADGIFLYDKHKRRIGGPYATEEEATRASKAVSEAMGERPVEDYKGFLRETNPGIIGGQSPIPEEYRQYSPPVTPGLLEDLWDKVPDMRARKFEASDLKPIPRAKPFDMSNVIPLAEAQELAYRGSTYDPALGGASPPNYQALGLMPSEQEGLLSPGFVTDIEYDPKEHRVPIDPTPARWGADMSGVKFGTALPDRTAVEDMILEASGIAGVAPQYTEGLRTEAQNTELGAHEKSKHLTGQAFDLAISGNKARDERYERELKRLFIPLGFSVVLKSDHIHLQTPPPGTELLSNSSWSN